jgi:hypothetical protein
VASRRGQGVLKELGVLFNVGTLRDLTDGQLLERFAAGPVEVAELAFAALVERHGAMVYRVCWARLGDEHDARDAFQATFLVLVKKARASGSGNRSAPGSIKWPCARRHAPGRRRCGDDSGNATRRRSRRSGRKEPNWPTAVRRRCSTRSLTAFLTVTEPP